MKNCARILVIGVLVAGLAGCVGTGAGDKEKQGKDVIGSVTFVSEDYKPGSEKVMKTEKGYYYYSNSEQGFRYYDIVTGKEMFLCNKPECRHDGNEFCVATNDKYTIDRVTLYGDRIIATAIEQTETQILYHLLAIALDGSEMDEVVTYLTLEKTGVEPGIKLDDRGLCIHRNRAMIPLWISGDADTQSFGTAVVNLDTRAVTYLDEEPLSKDNIGITDITAHGDYFYYCKKEGKKTVLYRYSIKDGADENFKLLTGFKGIYAVLGDKIFYAKGKGDALCVHHMDTGENEEKPLSRMHIKYAWNGTGEEEELKYQITDLLTDGTYLYIPEATKAFVRNEPDAGGVAEWTEAYLNIFDSNGEAVKSVNLVEELQCEADGETVCGEPTSMYFLGEEVFCKMYSEDHSKQYLFKCKRSDLLIGTPEFECVMKQ